MLRCATLETELLGKERAKGLDIRMVPSVPEEQETPIEGTISSQIKLSTLFLNGLSGAVAINTTSPVQRNQPSWYSIRAFCRPKVAQGFRSVEWNCDCGQCMYWDVKGISAQRAEVLASGFTCQSYNHPAGVDEPDDSSSSLSAPAAVHSPVLDGTYWSSDVPASRALFSNNPTISSKAIHVRLSPNYRFLELCINTGTYERTLGEIDITDIDSDGALFEKIATTYREKREKHGIIQLSLPTCFRQSNCQLKLPLAATETALGDLPEIHPRLGH